MDIKWKSFRYGTEKMNPPWSFLGSALCPGAVLTALALARRRDSGVCLATGLWFLVFSVICLVHLGRMMKNERKNLLPVHLLDRTCPDLVLFFLVCILLCNGDSGWWSYISVVDIVFGDCRQSVIFLWRFCSLFFMTGTVVLFSVVLYMSVMRHLFREKLKKKLFFYRAERFIKRKFGKRWEVYRILRAEKGRPAKKFRQRQMNFLAVQGIALLLLCLCVGSMDYDSMILIMPIAIVCFFVDLIFLLRTSKEVGILMDEISQIADDKQVWEGPVLKPYSIFRRTEEALFDIRKNKKDSMEKRIQSERMKVELITNVSHDLKTPLTSMIGCIDLLKQVKDLPEEARDYVTLLSGKAERLREMIQDVFEMAKATSGAQDMQIERLDMVRLIRQTMADMQDRIKSSGLHYRVKAEDRELPFLGDSKKMYRVYQNLIENTLKYSMAGSRVYVEIREQEGKILTSIKNTSACEMDFNAEEIIERFTRGDKSRSTEGNGLGLAIARSFTLACSGSFSVTLDGDLFKVETVFLKEDSGQKVDSV